MGIRIQQFEESFHNYGDTSVLSSAACVEIQFNSLEMLDTLCNLIVELNIAHITGLI